MTDTKDKTGSTQSQPGSSAAAQPQPQQSSSQPKQPGQQEPGRQSSRQPSPPAQRQPGEQRSGTMMQPFRHGHLARGGERAPSFPAAFRELWSQSPFTLMRRLSDDMDRMLGSFFGGGGSREMAARESAAWAPEVEVLERDGHILVRADVPGMSNEDVRVEVTEDAVVIEGERRQEHEENREGWYRSERSYGRFLRTVPLPEGADPDSASATMRDGVLEIDIAAPGRAKRSRKVEVKGGSQQKESGAGSETAGGTASQAGGSAEKK